MSQESFDLFRNSFSPEELENMFSGFPTGQKSTESKSTTVSGAWTISEEPLLQTPTHQEFVVRNTDQFDVAVILGLLKTHSYLRWDAAIPSQLQPGKDADEYISGFETMIFNTLPDRIMRMNMSQAERKEQMKGRTTIAVHHRDGSERMHEMFKDVDNRQFFLDFCTNAHPFDSLHINYDALDPKNKTSLSLLYPKHSYDAGSIRLELPLLPLWGSSWNQELARWVLETHAKTHGKQQDKAVFVNLSKIVSAKVLSHRDARLSEEPPPNYGIRF